MESVMVLEENHYISERKFSKVINKQFDLDLNIKNLKVDLAYFVDEFKDINDFTKICSKDEVIAYIKEKFDVENEYLDIYISKEIINVWEIKDVFNKDIFPSKPLLQGWFIWVDPCNVANWSHECYYYFMVDRDLVYKSVEQWIPNANLIIDKI